VDARLGGVESRKEGRDTVEQTMISSVEELIQANGTAWDKFGMTVWYRGHARASSEWKLLPAVRRKYDPEDEQSLALKFRAKALSRYPPLPGA